MEYYIKFEHYYKEIKKNNILNDINISLEKGKIYGLYGRNGSGKTMMLRAIAGLIKPTSGKVLVNNKEIGKDIDFAENTGIIIENQSLYPEYSGYKNLKILSKIQNKATDTDIYNALSAVGLDPKDPRKVKKYSLGMKQKLNIAQAIFEDQELLLLDEPTNALDTESIKGVYELFIKLKKQGKTIIIASHVYNDLENYCDEIIFIDNGKIKEMGKYDDKK